MNTFNRLGVTAFASVMALGIATAQAFPGHAPMKFTGPLKVALPTHVQMVDSNGRLYGPRIDLRQLRNDRGAEAPPWVHLWDSQNTNGLVDPPVYASSNAFNDPTTDPTSFFWFFGPSYQSQRVANDMVVWPGRGGRWATRYSNTMFFDPDTNATAGVGNLTLVVATGTGFVNTNNPSPAFGNSVRSYTGGIAITFTGLTEGGWILDSGNLAPVGFGLPMPRVADGAFDIYYGRVVGTSIVQLSATEAAQTLWGDPKFSASGGTNGVNLSSATPLQWDDDGGYDATGGFNPVNSSDWIHQNFSLDPWAELYTYAGLAGIANPQPMATFLADDAVVTLSGTVTWSNIDTPSRRPATATFQMTGVDGSGNPVPGPRELTWTVNVDQTTGAYQLIHPRQTVDGTPTGVPIEQYVVSMKGGTFLRRNVTVDFTSGNQTASFVMINGDVNDDNIIDGLDLGALDASFNLALGEAGFNDNADLNKDDVVDGLDLAILDANFNSEGDPDLTP